MLYLDYLAYNNALKHVSVGEKLLLGGGGLLLALVMPGPATLLAIIVLMHAVMLYARVPPAYLRRLWLAPLAFLLAGVAGVAVSVSPVPFAAVAAVWLGPYQLGITAGGLSVAGSLIMRSAAAVSCLMMLAATTPVAYVTGYLSRFKATGAVAEIAMLTYRFIFVFLAAAGQIYTAQQSRLGYVDSRRSLDSLALLAASVGRKTFLAAKDLHVALSARGYRDRLCYSCPPQTVKPARLAGIAALLAGVALTGLL